MCFFLFILILQEINKEISFIFLIGTLLSYSLFNFKKMNNFLIEKIFLKNQKLKHIVPGDVPLSDVIYKNKIIFLNKDVKNGFTEEQITYLNKRIKNKNFKMKVNWGIPFIPMMFFSFIFLFVPFFSNWLILKIKKFRIMYVINKR